MPPASVDLHFAFLDHLGIALPQGARILDFGCGAGEAVAALCARGYDCLGVDTNPFWRGAWGEAKALAGRVSLIDAAPYRLPFADRSFDFCFSDQVFEHVADCPAAMRELGRVLKPDAVSLHRFPGPNCLYEGHVLLPLPWLCRSDVYLTIGALLGRRAEEQRGFTWRQTVADNRRRMSETFYPTKRDLRRHAAEAGVKIEFYERAELDVRRVGRLATLQRACRAAGIGGLGRLALAVIASRYMLLRSGAVV